MNIRKPVVAGQFYSANPNKLIADIYSYTNSVNHLDLERKIRAVIVPHAGYSYSGETAGKVFDLLKKFTYKRIFVLAPSHTTFFYGIALSDFSHYQTPLGNIEIDNLAIKTILNSSVDSINIFNDAHISEHSLEVELPFIQCILPDTPIVPIICGRIKSYSEIADILSAFWDEDTLWVISSDFTHYGQSFDYVPFTKNVPEELQKLDGDALNLIKAKDFDGFQKYLERTGVTICGVEPIKILLKILQISSKNESIQSEVIYYTNSGELTGDYSHCVSYAGVVFL